MCAEMEKYTLIVTEKPDAAQRIASALNEKGKVERIINLNPGPFDLTILQITHDFSNVRSNFRVESIFR